MITNDLYGKRHLPVSPRNEKHAIIAVCISGTDEYSQTAFVNMILKYTELFSFRVVFFTSFTCTGMAERYSAGELNIYRLINFNMLDGLILFGETIKSEKILSELVKKANDADIPIVTIDHAIEGCINIVLDYHNAMEKIARHIIANKTYRHIEFIGGIPNNPASVERLNIFKQIMTENNREVTEGSIHYGYFWNGPTEVVMDEILAREKEDMPDALICANDAMAITACRRLNEAGFDVPHDVSVTGFDGLIEALYHTPSITTACLDTEKAVHRAFSVFDAFFRGDPVSMTYIIDFKVIFGASSDCRSDLDSFKKSNMIQSLYDEARDNFYFSNRMVDMTAALSDNCSLNEVAEGAKNYVTLLNNSKIWLCVINSFIRETSKITTILDNDQISDHPYTSKMNCILYKRYESFIHISPFLTERMLPHFYDEIEESKCLLIAPLHVLDKTIGYFAIDFYKTKVDFKRLLSFTNSFSNILETVRYHIEQKKVIDSLEIKSSHDALTGIYNRYGFFTLYAGMYEKAYKNHKELTVISVDLDNLKEINDKYGHSEGDDAIIAISNALFDVSSDEFIVARTGGDEFLVAGVTSKEISDDFERKFKALLSAYNRTSSKPDVAASLGIFSKIPDNTTDGDAFIKNADSLMYKQKAEHKSINGIRN